MADTTSPLRLSAPSEWLEAVPYLFGFAPTHSLVLLGLLGARRRVVFQMRVDLPAAGSDAAPLAEHVVACLRRQAVDDVLVVVYGDGDGAPTRAERELWSRLRERLPGAVGVVDALVVHGDRWWSLVCDDPRCCPAEGTPWSTTSGSRVAAEMVLRGCVVRGSRDDLVAEIAAVGGPSEDLVAQRCRALLSGEGSWRANPRAWPTARVDAAVEQWRQLVTSTSYEPADVDADRLAALLVPLDHRTLRDRVAGVCLRHPRRATTILREVVRRAPAEWVAAPATILGLLEWADGDGIRAAIAFDRALDADPDYSFAVMLAEGLRHGVRLDEDFLDSVRDMGRPRWRPASAGPSRRSARR